MQNIVVDIAETSAIASGQKRERVIRGSFARKARSQLVAALIE